MAIIINSPISTATNVIPTLFVADNGLSSQPFISSDMGLRAARIHRTTAEGAGSRTQVQGVRQLNNAEHKLSAYNGQIVAYGIRLRVTGNLSANSFMNAWSWTSFISGTTGSGPFAIGWFGGRWCLTTHFGTQNPAYPGTAAQAHYVTMPQPTDWTDYVVTAMYSKSNTGGWIEIRRKLTTATSFSQLTFPGVNVLRYVQRTLGESLVGDNNRYGFYGSAATNCDAGLAACYAATGNNATQEVINIFGGGITPPPPTGQRVAPSAPIQID
jgi:hypothetical protein